MSVLSFSARAVAGAAVLGVVATASAQGAAAALDLTAGHVDVVDVAYVAGTGLELSVHDESVTPSVERDPAEVRLVALPGARTSVPASAAYSFLGSPGAPVWILPEEQDAELLWPGISAEEVAPGAFANDRLTLQVTGVTGPDGVSVFSTVNGAPQVLLDTEDAAPGTLPVVAGEHLHANWAFEAAGDYTISYRVSGTLAGSGQVVTSDVVTLAFQVRA